jgi:hypothetical protein
MDMNMFEEWLKIDFQKCYLITNKSKEVRDDPRQDGKNVFQLKTGKPRGHIPLSSRRRRHRHNNVT